jgi:hypothetical protein
MKTLWVLAWHDPALAEKLWPELDDCEIVVSREFFAVVAADYANLDAALRRHPHIRLAGHPADGRWFDRDGREVYILNGEVGPSREALWEGLGLKPRDFDAETWGDADTDLVWSQVKTF